MESLSQICEVIQRPQNISRKKYQKRAQATQCQVPQDVLLSLGSALKTCWQHSGPGQSPRFLAVCSCPVQTLHAFPLGTKLESSGRYCGISRNVQQGCSCLPTLECESLMREAFLLVGALSLHKPMAALYASPKKREASSSLSQRQREGYLSCKATRSRTSGACSWIQDAPGCLTLPILPS